MRKIVSLLSVLMLFCAVAFGQTRTVTGVVSDEKGNPIPNATVAESGTNNAVKADATGSFSIRIREGGQITISAVGYDARTITPGVGQTSFSLTTGTDVQETVVVTALGIRRKAEEIGYSTSTVKADQITNGRPINLAQSLSGKVSGLNIANTSASVNASPRITLRGLRSITGDNTALIVLDGVPVPSNTINYINPNDVDRIDVMKGGQAATLFGSEGVNGAIIITTKKGSQRPEITFQHSSNVEKLSYLAKTQHSFGSGSAYGSNREENFHPAENQQYGPRYDGQLRPAGRQLADGSIQLLPYSDISDVRRKIFNTGYTGQTDLSYRAGDANSSFFASFQNLHSDGIVPDDSYNRNVLRMNAGRTFGKSNLSFDATYSWDHAERTNSDFIFFALNTASWIPLDQYRDWRTNKFADPSGYFNDYYNNPWWQLDNNRFEDRNNYFNGNVKFTVKPINALELTARVALATTNFQRTQTGNNYTYTGFSKTAGFVNYFNNNYDRYLTGLGRSVSRTPVAGSMEENQSLRNRIVGDLFAVYNKEFGIISLKAIVGAQAQHRTSKDVNVSTNGIGQSDLFNFSNSATGLFSATNNETALRKIGGFGDLTFGFKNMIYLHGAVRRDYSSVFSGPAFGYNDPSFTTYGGDVSFIISDLIPGIKGNVVDNFKIRASYNKNGNDNLLANQLQVTYNNASGFPYAGLIGTSVGNVLVSPNLRPETVKTAEVGFEIGFLKNRFSLEGTYYKQKAEDQILKVGISPAAGAPEYLLNAADVSNQGYEFDLKTNLFRNKDWNVNFNANYSHNTNEVLELYGATGLKSYQYQSPDALASINAEVGQMFPYLKTTVFERDPQGRVIVDTTDGWPLRASQRAGQGTTLPVHILGTGINVSFRNLTLIANAEYRAGNVVYFDLGTDMTFTGSGAITAIYERDQFVWPNSVYVNAAGKYVPNTNFAVDNYKAIYQGFGDIGFSRGFAGNGEMYMASGAFWKLRDVSLTYEFGKSLIGRVRAVKGIALTAWARNLVTLLPDDNWYTDPEFSNTSTSNGTGTANATGLSNSFNTPPTRQIGGTIRITF